jgi:transcriptional regulator with XRE-family HTH domain
MSIGTRIREARKAAKLTQKQLAKRVGMAQGSLSELETGVSHATTLIASIAAACGVNALWLETGKGLPRATNDAAAFSGRQARMILAYEDEAGLLDLFRRTDDRGRFEIIKLATREASRVGDDPP